MRMRILEQISITNHKVVRYKALNSFKIQIWDFNSEIQLILGRANII